MNRYRKVCIKCNKDQSLDDFYMRKKVDGSFTYRNTCKKCTRKQINEWSEKNPERKKTAALKWAKNNRDKRNAYQKTTDKKLTPEQKKIRLANKRKTRAALVERKEIDYIEKFGEPKCSCGCGQPVRFTTKGVPAKYTKECAINVRALAASKKNAAYWESERVELDKLRKFLRVYKEKNHLTWMQVAERGGLHMYHLHSLLYSDRVQSKGVTKEWTERLLNRLAGKAEIASTHQKTIKAQKEQAYSETQATSRW